LQGLSFRLCSSISLKRGNLVLGDRPSCLGECASPKRELACVLCVLVAYLVQAGWRVLSEGASRPGESLSPKREFESGSTVLLNLSPGRGSFILGERGSRPSEYELT